MSALPWVYDDGGRAAAGFRGTAGDCVVRAIAIAAEADYRDVYEVLHHEALGDRGYMAKLELRYGAQARRHASPRSGVPSRIYGRYLAAIGFRWVPTMAIGSGCTVHLAAGELPSGRLVVAVSRHLTAVVDGTVRDTHNPSREGSRCVYGYYEPAP